MSRDVCSLVLPIVICISREVIDLSVIVCNIASITSLYLEIGTIRASGYYERQLIDLKIRLDTIDLENVPKSEIKSKKASIEPTNTEQVEKNEESQTTSTQIVPISRYSDVIDAILHTITDKSMTSRDIQITIGRTREHTSRLMKKLSDDGLVQRHAGTKPFVYSLTDEGKKKLEIPPMLSK